MPKGPKTKLSPVKWSVFYQNRSVIQINSILLIKKGRSLRGKKSAFAVLRLFENSVPKHDEYHQGNSEYDHGLKFTSLWASAFFGHNF